MRFREDIMKKIYAISALLTFVGLQLIAMQMDMQDQVNQKQLYCENVELWKETKGQQGWPDYNENYEQLCTRGMFD